MKALIAFVRHIFTKYREQILYLIVGVMTTVVNFAVYYLLSKICGLHYLFINWIAWAAAVIFAFFPNRSLVFRDTRKGKGFSQFFAFVSSRVATFLIEEGLLFFSVDILHFDDGIMKPVVSVVVVVLNYVFSKLFVFRRRGGDTNA